MSKKLLSEAQVRRFQSLACIKPLQEMESFAPVVEEEVVTEEEINEEMYEMEMAEEEVEEEVEEADVALDQDLVEKFADAVETIQQVSSTLNSGVDGEVADGMELAPIEDEMEMDAAPEEEAEEMEMDAAPMADEEVEEEEMELQEALDGVDYVPSQEEIIKAVAKRVAARLQEAKTAQARLDKALGKK